MGQEVTHPVGTPIYDQLKAEFHDARVAESMAMGQQALTTGEILAMARPPAVLSADQILAMAKPPLTVEKVREFADEQKPKAKKATPKRKTTPK